MLLALSSILLRFLDADVVLDAIGVVLDAIGVVLDAIDVVLDAIGVVLDGVDGPRWR